jgi:ERCC4-type nuclease
LERGDLVQGWWDWGEGETVEGGIRVKCDSRETSFCIVRRLRVIGINMMIERLRMGI